MSLIVNELMNSHCLLTQNLLRLVNTGFQSAAIYWVSAAWWALG